MEQAPIKWWFTFSSGDDVVFAYLLYLVLVFAVDIIFGFSTRMTKILKLKFAAEDSVFAIGFVSHLLFLILNLHYDFIGHFLAIVDYSHVRYNSLRMVIVTPTFFVFALGGPLLGILCGIIAFRRGMRFWKWLAYGFFFNVLALARLLTFQLTEQSVSRKNPEGGA